MTNRERQIAANQAILESMERASAELYLDTGGATTGVANEVKQELDDVLYRLKYRVDVLAKQAMSNGKEESGPEAGDTGESGEKKGRRWSGKRNDFPLQFHGTDGYRKEFGEHDSDDPGRPE